MEVIDEMNGSSIEVVLPGIPPEQRDQYGEVHSQVIEDVLKEKVARSGKKYFVVKFTDCRKELVSLMQMGTFSGVAYSTRPILSTYLTTCRLYQPPSSIFRLYDYFLHPQLRSAIHLHNYIQYIETSH